MSDAEAAATEKPRRRPLLTALKLLLVAILLCVIALPVLYMCSTATSRTGWARVAQKLQADIARQRADRGERELLEGSPEPGNAWDDYLKEMMGFPRVSSEDDYLLIKCFDSSMTTGDESRLTAMLDAATPAMDRITALTRRERAKQRVDWDKGVEARTASMEARPVSRYLCADARRWRMAGNLDRALDRLAVDFQLALDISRPVLVDHLVCLSLLQSVTSELHRLLLGLPWTPAQLDRADHLLLEVDRQLPPLADALDGEAILDCVSLRKLAEGEMPAESVGVGSSVKGLTAWRRGFSWKLLALETAGHVRQVSETARRAGKLEWGAAQHEWEEFEKMRMGSKNRISECLALAYCAADQSHRICIARLRLLRCLIQEKRGAPPEPLEDPFSRKPLQRIATPTTLKIWSVGVYGDQGGRGSFDPLKGDDDDIVIEIDRK